MYSFFTIDIIRGTKLIDSIPGKRYQSITESGEELLQLAEEKLEHICGLKLENISPAVQKAYNFKNVSEAFKVAAWKDGTFLEGFIDKEKLIIGYGPYVAKIYPLRRSFLSTQSILNL